mmetsp:Transcript_149750/g.480890  ORF Transcript_149750/g.480890 Transcript_149750/m.480890 type:complete len:421 (+) Transcript_149750:654-1916(+)
MASHRKAFAPWPGLPVGERILGREKILEDLVSEEAHPVAAGAWPARAKAPLVNQGFPLHHRLESGGVHETSAGRCQGEDVVEEVRQIAARRSDVAHRPAVQARVVDQVVEVHLLGRSCGILVGRELVGEARVLQATAQLREAREAVATGAPEIAGDDAELIEVLPREQAFDLHHEKAEQHIVRPGVRRAGARRAHEASLARAHHVAPRRHVLAAVADGPVHDLRIIVIRKAALHAQKVAHRHRGSLEAPESHQRHVLDVQRRRDVAAVAIEALQHGVDPISRQVAQRQHTPFHGLHDAEGRPRLRHGAKGHGRRGCEPLLRPGVVHAGGQGQRARCLREPKAEAGVVLQGHFVKHRLHRCSNCLQSRCLQRFRDLLRTCHGTSQTTKRQRAAEKRRHHFRRCREGDAVKAAEGRGHPSNT